MDDRPVIVHPSSPTGGRRVSYDSEILGLAHRLADVEEFLRRAGVDDPESAVFTLVEWRGGGPDVWTQDEAPPAG